MSLIDDLKTPTPWNWGTRADGVTMYNDTVKPLDDNIRMVASAVDNLPQPSEQVQANWNTSAASDPSFIKNKPTIPSKTSQLQNDAGFITDSAIPSVPTKTSDLDNDSGFITAGDIPAQVNPDWSVDDASDPRCILNKPESVDQVQADWNTSATSAASYIKNKPWVPEELHDFGDCRKVLMIDYQTQSPQWKFPLVVPDLEFNTIGSGLNSEEYTFSSCAQVCSAAQSSNFATFFHPHSLTQCILEFDKLKTKYAPESCPIQIFLTPFEEPSGNSRIFDGELTCPIPVDENFEYVEYSGHGREEGNYIGTHVRIPITVFNNSSAYKGIAIQYGYPNQDYRFVPQTVTFRCNSFARIEINNWDKYTKNNYFNYWNSFSPDSPNN